MKKVLIAEDDEILREVIEVILMNEEFRLLYASTGPQLIELAQIEKPDVIVAKLKLPGLNGLEVLQRLKSEASTFGIPVILVGANDDPSDIKMCIESGASAHLVKPFSPMKFFAYIDLALRERQQ